MHVKPPIKQPQYKNALRQFSMLIETRASRAYLGGNRGCAKAFGAPADRMRERAALSYNHRFRQRWQDVAINVFDMAAPSSWMMSPDKGNRTIGRIWAKVS